MPCLILFVLHAVVICADRIFIGQNIGHIGNCAFQAVLPILLFAFAAGILIGSGSASMIRSRLYRKKFLPARRCFSASISMALVIGALLSVLFGFFLIPFLKLCGTTNTIIPYAADLGRASCLFLLLTVLNTTLFFLLRAEGAAGTAAFGQIAGLAAHVLLSYAVLYKWHLGIFAPALAAGAGHILCLLIYIYYLLSPKRVLRFRSAGIRKSLGYNSRIFRAGLPIGLPVLMLPAMLLPAGYLIMQASADSSYGSDAPFAAIGCTLLLMAVFETAALSCCVAAAAYISGKLRKKEPKALRAPLLHCFLCSAFILAAGTLLFYFAADIVTGLYGSVDPRFQQYMQLCLQSCPLLMAADAVTFTASALLYSTEKYGRIYLLSALHFLLIPLPAMYILNFLYGFRMLAYAFPIAAGVTAAAALPMLIHTYRTVTASEMPQYK